MVELPELCLVSVTYHSYICDYICSEIKYTARKATHFRTDILI
jgi:hypothetical protein